MGMFAPESPGHEPEGRAKEIQAAALVGVSPDEGGIAVETEVAEGQPARVPVEAGRGAGLLEVGGGFRELLLGSVSQQCAHLSRARVVIVRHYPQEERVAS